jgi:hypothetical protein
MKAINFNNEIFKINSEKGDFYVTENNKGKLKMFAKHEVEVIEIEEMPKAKVFKKIVCKKEYTEKYSFEQRLNMALQDETGRTGSNEFLSKISNY